MIFASKNLDHVVLRVGDLERAIRFYTDVLGFSVTQRRGSDHHAYLERGSAQLMIAHWEQDGVWEPAPLETPYGRGVNFFIWVEDIHALYERVQASNIRPFVELHTRWYWRTDRMDER